MATASKTNWWVQWCQGLCQWKGIPSPYATSFECECVLPQFAQHLKWITSSIIIPTFCSAWLLQDHQYPWFTRWCRRLLCNCWFLLPLETQLHTRECCTHSCSSWVFRCHGSFGEQQEVPVCQCVCTMASQHRLPSALSSAEFPCGWVCGDSMS